MDSSKLRESTQKATMGEVLSLTMGCPHWTASSSGSRVETFQGPVDGVDHLSSERTSSSSSLEESVPSLLVVADATRPKDVTPVLGAVLVAKGH